MASFDRLIAKVYNVRCVVEETGKARQTGMGTTGGGWGGEEELTWEPNQVELLKCSKWAGKKGHMWET